MYDIAWLFCPALLTITIILLLRNFDIISNSPSTKAHNHEGMSILYSHNSLSASSVQFPKNSDQPWLHSVWSYHYFTEEEKKIHPFLNGNTFSHLDILPKGIKSNFLLLKFLCLTFYFVWSYETWYKQISLGLCGIKSVETN